MSLRVPRKTCSHCLEVSKLKGIAKCCLTSHKSVRCKTFGFKKTCVLKDQQYKVLNKQTMNRFILWWKKKRETERPLAAVTSSEHVSPGVVPGFSLLLVRPSMTKVEIWLTLQNKPNQLLSQILASLCLTRNPAASRGRCFDGASCGCLRCCFNAAGNSSDGHIFLFMPEKLLFIMHAWVM